MRNWILLCGLLSTQANAQEQERFISKPIRQTQTIECADHDPERHELKHALHIADSLGISTKYKHQNKAILKFSWPLKWVNQTPGNSFYSLSNYFENDPTGLVRDYNCGKRSYNGHKGTDIYPWPGWWLSMDNQEVDVVAAAGGRIITKLDGNYDRNCTMGNQNWNAIYLEHPGGGVTWYGHLKKSSLTGKGLGDSISEGEFLGKVGSSGRSTGPHLHFEVYESGIVIDPYAGACNSGMASRWKNQHSYYNQALIRSFCTSGEPIFPPCPQQENLKKDSIYAQGDSIYLTNYYRDLKNGDTTILLLRNPMGVIIDSLFTIHNISPDVFYDAGGWLWKRKLGPTASDGIYAFESKYRGNTLISRFIYAIPTSINAQEKRNTSVVYELDFLKVRGFSEFEYPTIFDLTGRQIKVTTEWEGEYWKIGRLPFSGVYLLYLKGKKAFLISKK